MLVAVFVAPFEPATEPVSVSVSPSDYAVLFISPTDGSRRLLSARPTDTLELWIRKPVVGSKRRPNWAYHALLIARKTSSCLLASPCKFLARLWCRRRRRRRRRCRPYRHISHPIILRYGIQMSFSSSSYTFIFASAAINHHHHHHNAN